jgi:hypothetical protein
MKGRVINRAMIRSNSVDGNPAKQYLELVQMENGEYILNIERLRLVDEVDPEEKHLKTYKGKHLYSAEFGIKLDTLSKITGWLGEILIEQ